MLPIPQGFTTDITTLQASSLKSKGIALVLADLDNTLVSYGGTEPPEKIVAWKNALAQENIPLFILSNSRKPGRVEDFAQKLQVPYKTRAGKPRKSAFADVLAQYQVQPQQTLMVGDQIFTDILGATSMGIPAVLVRPVALHDHFGRMLRYYLLEAPFRSLAKKNF